ncbi:hypothetical protein [Stenotrophomonas sp. MMGLT7]|uniref:hypothetical protein n=1 Tax=Stenotrophomonas sp. MMGLT7 TaxID=2901227 RepID=UPI001E5E8697|nr:hypothetical protein [Stenotrophomonas sp. MMGLT7]MCD7096898.1 hypothetical protein [Stenotrophomonas sp. MMGLT7]
MTFLTVRNVLTVAAAPQSTTARRIGQVLGINPERARKLKALAVAATTPTLQEYSLMRQCGINLAEARAYIEITTRTPPCVPVAAGSNLHTWLKDISHG